MAKLDALIEDTWAWYEQHKGKGRKIEMLACKIRLKALLDAKMALEAEQ